MILTDFELFYFWGNFRKLKAETRDCIHDEKDKERGRRKNSQNSEPPYSDLYSTTTSRYNCAQFPLVLTYLLPQGEILGDWKIEDFSMQNAALRGGLYNRNYLSFNWRLSLVQVFYFLHATRNFHCLLDRSLFLLYVYNKKVLW